MSRINKRCVVFGLFFLASIIASMGSVISHGVMILYATLALYTVSTLVPKIQRWIDRADFVPDEHLSGKQGFNVSLMAGVITFLVLLIWFTGSYPGYYSPDSIDQLEQAMTGIYNDWFPVLHTLLAYTLPLKLTGWPASIVLCQILWFSVMMGCYAKTVYVYAGSLFTKLSVAFIICSPFTLEIVMYPWKDTALGIVAGFCMLFAVHVYFTKGQWCNSIPNLVMMSFMLAIATILRHNAILFTFFLIAGLFFFMSGRRWIQMVMLSALFFILIKFPLYSFLGVQKPGDRLLEVSGLPLSIITTVVKECPEKVDGQTASFVDDLMAPQPDWKEYHCLEGFNSVKFRGIDKNVIEEAGPGGILKMTLDCFVSAPLVSLRSIYGVTRPVYELGYGCVIIGEIVDNDLGLVYKGCKVAGFLKSCYRNLVYKTPLRIIFSSIAITILVMLAFMLFRSDFRSTADWKRIMLCIPVLIYDSVTMLLLTWHDVRFFYMNWIVCPLVVLIMGRKNATE